MSVESDYLEDDDSDDESGDLFGQVIKSLGKAREQLAELQSSIRTMDACEEFSAVLHHLVELLDELDEALADAPDMDFEEQNELLNELAEERGGPIADVLREAGAMFQAIPWAEAELPDARVQATTDAWEQASESGWVLHSKLTEVL